MGEVDPGVAVLQWQEWHIEAGANAAQEHARRRRRQASQTSGALCAGSCGQRRVVERGDQRVTVLEAQCRAINAGRVVPPA